MHLATAAHVNQFYGIDEFHTYGHDLLKFNGRPETPILNIEATFELYPDKLTSLYDALGNPEE